ncbi:MAG: hypothetical protein MH213_03475 [Marinobacter sp.]|nr:hypothetical protein [Marinobacter sp.]
MVEIPMADLARWRSGDCGRAAGERKIAMAGHTRRFNPSHQYLHQEDCCWRVSDIQQMDVQTYFFRRTNANALSQPRSWTDHLLWHHAAHTVDLFQYQTGEKIVSANAIQGPKHPELGIAMDMSIQLKTETGKICTPRSHSIMTDRSELSSAISATTEPTLRGTTTSSLGNEEQIDVSKVDVSMNGIEQDREFVAAIIEGREPT